MECMFRVYSEDSVYRTCLCNIDRSNVNRKVKDSILVLSSNTGGIYVTYLDL